MRFVLKLFGLGAVSYLCGSYYLSLKLPNVSYNNLPKKMTMKTIVAHTGCDIPYCDTFRVVVRDKSMNLIKSTFFNSSLIRMSLGSNGLETRIISEREGKEFNSTLQEWEWKDPNIVLLFEKLARWGYPFRMMNGGYHELYIEPCGQFYRVYYASAHEYRDLNDGKVIPKWTQHCHRTYARLILWLAFN